VPVGVAIDAHDPVLRLPVLVWSQDGAQACSLAEISISCPYGGIFGGTTPRRFHIVKVKFHFWIFIVTLLTSLAKVSEQLNTRGRE
jgi:hypothetical protein